nr:hypothetical protein [Candidatus Cloacimonadota bacterium]
MKTTLSTIFLLMCAVLLFGQWHIEEGFEGSSTLPDGWIYYDDGDGMTWRVLENSNYAHSGTHIAFADNYHPNQNEDWLITPQVSINSGDNLEFYTRAWYGTESIKVYVSTTGNQIDDFNTLLHHEIDFGSTYQQVSVPLDSYVGMNIYVGFLWECDTYGVILDDVRLGQEAMVDPELNLPAEISFFASETHVEDFSEYIVVTDPDAAVLSVEENDFIQIEIDGFEVSFSAIDYIGSQEITFTLLDELSMQSVDASVLINVLEDPISDLYIIDVSSPRAMEFMNLEIFPTLTIGNSGAISFENNLELELQVYNEQDDLLYGYTYNTALSIPAGDSILLEFPEAYIPTQEGEQRFVFEILTDDGNAANNIYEALVTVFHRIMEGGPDDFGYYFVESNSPSGPVYDWIDISETGQSTIMYGVSSWSGDDNFSEPIPLGFDFPFYGENYSSANVDINGEILFAESSWYNPYPEMGWDNDGNMFNYMYPIPGYAQMPALIAVYWDDLEADEGIGNIYFESFGTAPERYAIIQWDNLRFRSGSGGDSLLKFQVILHENGEIKMQYHTVATSQTGASIPHDNGLSATIAIQNEAANAGLTYLREIVQGNSYIGIEPAGNILHDNLAILFYPGIDEQTPIITHKPIGNTFDESMEFVANMTDMSLPLDAKLIYDVGSGWQELQATTIEGSDYYFLVASLPQGSQVKYYFSAEDTEGNIGSLPATAPTEYYSFQILPTADTEVLIAYSGNQDYQRIELPTYQAALEELGIAYDIYDWEEYPSYSFPAQYKGIIAYANSGTASDKMYTFAEELINFLDLGTETEPKNLWFASDNLASSQHAHPNSSVIRKLMSGYFRTSYVPTGFGGGTNGLGGPDNLNYEYGTILALPGTPVGTVNREYPVYANSPDCIFPNDAAGDPYVDQVPYPEIGASYVYSFEDGPYNGQAYLYNGVNATTVETPSFRTMYFSFDFSQLTEAEDRLEWMDDLKSWWQLGNVGIDDPIAPMPNSELQSIYPNPFNPKTNIRYYLAQSEEVTLAIYNLKGQKVLDLVNETKAAGIHTVSWDGKDASGREVASGIYYLRLRAGKLNQTRKLTMIK